MEHIEKIIKDLIAWKSIKSSLIERKRINKEFVISFEEKEKLFKNKYWNNIKKELKYI